MHIKMSESIDKLAPALVKAVNAIEGVAKDNQAGGGGGPKYKYADLSSCLAEARRALSPHGLTIMQPPAVSMRDENGGEVHEPLIFISTIILHESGQWIAGEIVIPNAESRLTLAQAIGSMVTYMRRYSLCAMLSIPMEDDDGASAGHAPQRYDQRDDRRPAYNGRSEPARHTPSRPAGSAADRLADSVPRQPAARPAPRPPASRDDIPVDDSFGEPPPHVRR